jgi:hypothetical protein
MTDGSRSRDGMFICSIMMDVVMGMKRVVAGMLMIANCLL